ncbi:MazG-like family protein [Streptomyces griseoruber]|uniref:MazG-like family protein n=1 Tax=Streptomyces griseoruber TaxID=1943 RepID=UPI00379FCD48
MTESSAAPSPAPDIWPTIEALWTWLDTHRAHDGSAGLLLRMLKLSEEVGEVAEAVIGAMGQNPRKGNSHTWEDVQGELCDVVITALVALRTLTPEPERVFGGHLAEVAERSLGTGVRGGEADTGAWTGSPISADQRP